MSTEQMTTVSLVPQDDQPVDITKDDMQCEEILSIPRFNLISAIHFRDVKHTKMRKFLQYYANCGSIVLSSQAADICYELHFYWMKHYDGYPLLYEQSQAMHVDRLEREATRRAVDGVDKGVWYRGNRVGTEKQYSDLLLLAQLKANIPDKYKERTEVITKSDDVRVSHLSRGEMLAELAAELNRLQAKDMSKIEAIDVESKEVGGKADAAEDE